jgi:hypothetical protein
MLTRLRLSSLEFEMRIVLILAGYINSTANRHGTLATWPGLGRTGRDLFNQSDAIYLAIILLSLGIHIGEAGDGEHGGDISAAASTS